MGTDELCDARSAAFADDNSFEKKGGLKAMGESLKRGMVLVMSLWDDHAVNMLWLDSSYPTDQIGKPGVARGRADGNNKYGKRTRRAL